jgi:hypothetical protein
LVVHFGGPATSLQQQNFNDVTAPVAGVTLGGAIETCTFAAPITLIADAVYLIVVQEPSSTSTDSIGPGVFGVVTGSTTGNSANPFDHFTFLSSGEHPGGGSSIAIAFDDSTSFPIYAITLTYTVVVVAGGGGGDPHFTHALSGMEYLFHAERLGESYAVWSTPNTQLNAKFDGAAALGHGYQFISELALLAGPHRVHFTTHDGGRVTVNGVIIDTSDSGSSSSSSSSFAYDASLVGCFDIVEADQEKEEEEEEEEEQQQQQQHGVSSCVKHCALGGFDYAGISRRGRTCACMQRASASARLFVRPAAFCREVCVGSAEDARRCGSDQGMSLYETSAERSAATLEVSVATDAPVQRRFAWTDDWIAAHDITRTFTLRTHLWTLEVYAEQYNERGVRFPILNFRVSRTHDDVRFHVADGVVGQTAQGALAPSLYRHLRGSTDALANATSTGTSTAAAATAGGGGGVSSATTFASTFAAYPLLHRRKDYLLPTLFDTKFAYAQSTLCLGLGGDAVNHAQQC